MTVIKNRRRCRKKGEQGLKDLENLNLDLEPTLVTPLDALGWVECKFMDVLGIEPCLVRVVLSPGAES